MSGPRIAVPYRNRIFAARRKPIPAKGQELSASSAEDLSDRNFLHRFLIRRVPRVRMQCPGHEEEETVQAPRLERSAEEVRIRVGRWRPSWKSSTRDRRRGRNLAPDFGNLRAEIPNDQGTSIEGLRRAVFLSLLGSR